MSSAQESGQGVRKALADAEVSLRRRDYEGVISAAQQALVANPNSGVAHRFLYEAYLYRHDSVRSKEARDNALRLLKAPKDAREYEARGFCDLFNYPIGARVDFIEAIRLDPKYASAYNNRGRSYAYKKKHDLAIADYSEAIRLDPKYVSAYYYRAVAYRRIGREDLAKADESAAKGVNGK